MANPRRAHEGEAVDASGQSSWELLLYHLGLQESELDNLLSFLSTVAEFARKHYEQLFITFWTLESWDLSFRGLIYEMCGEEVDKILDR